MGSTIKHGKNDTKEITYNIQKAQFYLKTTHYTQTCN